MLADLRDTLEYREAAALYEHLREPGRGRISDAAEIHVSPDGQHAAFSGVIFNTLQRAPSSRICLTHLASGDTRVVSFGPNNDRAPKFAPHGHEIAFLSDRDEEGDFQLFLLDRATATVRAAPRVPGWIEYLHWSPDGKKILIGVAGYAADIAGTQGAVTSAIRGAAAPSWHPRVEIGTESHHWRSAWVYEPASNRTRRLSPSGINVWEAVWCGNAAIATVASSTPGEGQWYSAKLLLVRLSSGQATDLYTPEDQIGWPSASPSGRLLCVVDAICSDRWIVAGDLWLIEVASGSKRRIDTAGIDVAFTEWRSDRRLLIAGLRGLDTVVGLYDAITDKFSEVWASAEISTALPGIHVAGIGDTGNVALIGEGFSRAPELGLIDKKTYQPIVSFGVNYAKQSGAIESIDRVEWAAPDGLGIQGWLLRSSRRRRTPLVMNIHGGPVFSWRPNWLGRPRTTPMLMLLRRGHNIFYPNPRGSSGRGKAFATAVRGDMGGEDTFDFLSGLDHLVTCGIADKRRIGVMGISYGGYMTSWLVTQDSRFAAAVPIAPVSNRVTQRLTCTHTRFVDMFVGDRYDRMGGKYFTRSPVMYAHRVKTPTLNICGALDRCTPPSEAIQFHRALRSSGVKSELVIYPEEGHGVRKFPAAIDYAARLAMWFEEHLGVVPINGRR